MKTSTDPRHKKRRIVVKELFSQSFFSQEASTLTKKILENADGLDKKIAEAAPTWPIDKVNKIDLAILRLAVFELNEGITPQKVVIDEAIELAKEYGSEASSSFVNGVLGKIVSS